jgi:formylglycine-generating enzyme required for sulfatase activity
MHIHLRFKKIFLFIHALVVLSFGGAMLVSGDDNIANSIGMKFVHIKAGSFLMGSDTGETDERPAHKVNISKPFFIGAYEVTQEQWKNIMGNNPSTWKENPRWPVGNVSWNDAKAFCKKLSAIEGISYRLPTEAEWEYACRAGSATLYFWGCEFDSTYAWTLYNPGRSPQEVGTRKPNTWGLYDMAGNVWEWCEDRYNGSYPAIEQTDPRGPATGTLRVVRGGGKDSRKKNLNSCYRGNAGPNFLSPYIGFRVCRDK